MKRVLTPSLFITYPQKILKRSFLFFSPFPLLDKIKVGGDSCYPQNCDKKQNIQVCSSTVWHTPLLRKNFEANLHRVCLSMIEAFSGYSCLSRYFLMSQNQGLLSGPSPIARKCAGSSKCMIVIRGLWFGQVTLNQVDRVAIASAIWFYSRGIWLKVISINSTTNFKTWSRYGISLGCLVSHFPFT